MAKKRILKHKNHVIDQYLLNITEPDPTHHVREVCLSTGYWLFWPTNSLSASNLRYVCLVTDQVGLERGRAGISDPLSN